jgi:hypothetical protein
VVSEGVRVRLSEAQVRALRFFAGTHVMTEFRVVSCGSLIDLGLIERDEREKYRISESGRRVAAVLDRQRHEEGAAQK